MTKKTLTYYALVDQNKSPGVAKKINDTVIAARSIGIDAETKVFQPSFSGLIKFIASILHPRSNLLLIRFSDIAFPFLFLPLTFVRITGRKIIIDVPTPRSIALSEIDARHKSLAKRILRKSWTYLSGAWIFYPAHRILQYANESNWFSLGINYKTIKIGNGIVFSDKRPITRGKWPSSTLKLIAVAQIANWHGYDRLIKAIALLHERRPELRIEAVIVGDGDDLSNLKHLAQELHLCDRVVFTGSLTGTALDSAFEGAHIGVASLGLFRKNIQEASDLKTREYLSRGLPVIATGIDPDFSADSPFRFTVPNNEDISLLADLLQNFFQKELPQAEAAVNYAKDHLSLESKIKLILKDFL